MVCRPFQKDNKMLGCFNEIISSSSERSIGSAPWEQVWMVQNHSWPPGQLWLSAFAPVPQRGKASLRKRSPRGGGGGRSQGLPALLASHERPAALRDEVLAGVKDVEQLVALARKLGPVPTTGPVRHSSSPGEDQESGRWWFYVSDSVLSPFCR